MKKLIIVLIFMAVISPIFAQNNSGSGPEDMYYINLPVEKIYPSVEGYLVQYRRLTGGLGIVGIPVSWFYDAAGRAQLMTLPGGPDWPSLTIFYKNGEFSHVRLYTHKLKSHITWGNIPQGMDVNRYFSDQDTFNIEF